MPYVIVFSGFKLFNYRIVFSMDVYVVLCCIVTCLEPT